MGCVCDVLVARCAGAEARLESREAWASVSNSFQYIRCRISNAARYRRESVVTVEGSGFRAQGLGFRVEG
jgi:hypothetical protein